MAQTLEKLFLQKVAQMPQDVSCVFFSSLIHSIKVTL